MGESKVVDEVAVEKGLDSKDNRMGSTAFEPDVSPQVLFARGDRNKPSARLEDDPGLLCIDVNWTDTTGRTHQCVKNMTNFRVLAHEVLGDRVVTTGVRHVAGDEVLSALRALPEGLFLCSCKFTHG